MTAVLPVIPVARTLVIAGGAQSKVAVRWTVTPGIPQAEASRYSTVSVEPSEALMRPSEAGAADVARIEPTNVPEPAGDSASETVSGVVSTEERTPTVADPWPARSESTTVIWIALEQL